MPLPIINGFKYTGVYPFNSQIVLDKFPGADKNDTPAVPVTDDGKPSADDDENASLAGKRRVLVISQLRKKKGL